MRQAGQCSTRMRAGHVKRTSSNPPTAPGIEWAPLAARSVPWRVPETAPSKEPRAPVGPTFGSLRQTLRGAPTGTPPCRPTRSARLPQAAPGPTRMAMHSISSSITPASRVAFGLPCFDRCLATNSGATTAGLKAGESCCAEAACLRARPPQAKVC